eukprot:g12516.t1
MAGHDHFCSREHSRQSRKIIAQSVYPYLGKDPALIIPPECPLHPALDMFKDQEEHKRLVPGERDLYQCGYCQKQFRTEFYMDRHMENKHPDRLNLGRETDNEAGMDAYPGGASSRRCLADLCPVLGCGEYDMGDCRVEISSRGGGDGEEVAVRRGCGTCDPTDMARRRRECVALFDRCMNVSDGNSAARGEETDLEARHLVDLGDHFVRQFCDHLACDSHHRPLAPSFEGKGAGGRHPIPGSEGEGRGGMGMPKALVIAALVVGLIILYTSMALGHWSSRGVDSDGSTETENTATPNGNIRCLSFRPCGGGSVGSSAATGVLGGDENVPLTAWYDAGAAVLGSRGSRVVLPAPVIRERACGAWSGCGRRLAVSSGGEIRVYSDPLEETPLSMATVTIGVLDRRPVKTVAGHGDSDPTLSRGKQGAETLPLTTEVRAGWLRPDEDTQRGVVGSENTFRTALCVEATMYEGGILSSPGSSPGGGSPSSSSPSARQARTPPSPRSGISCGDRGSRGPTAASSSAPQTRTQSGALADGQGGQRASALAALSSPAAAAVTSSEGSSSSPPPLIGEMLAMCPAGPLAFFGTTDGGLGLDSMLATSSLTGASGPFPASSRRGMAKREGNELLGAIVDTSNAARTAAFEVSDASGVEPTSRRRGFRHVLPGENWLAGSLRPSSRSGSPSRQHQGSSSPESPSDTSHSDSTKPTGRDTANARPAAVECILGVSRSTAEPEILDLRGKLGGGAPGGGKGGNRGAEGSSVTLTHPLFRLSNPGGMDRISASAIGSDSKCGASNTGKDAAASVRRPWLVRVSCRSRSGGGGSSGNNGVGVKALASLPLGLASPDLLASSDDGRYVAVGSHACDLVACFLLELSSSDEGSLGTDEGQDAKSSSNPVAEGCHTGSTNGGPLAGRGSSVRALGKADKGGVRQRKRRHRRAVPLCTLRLPPGHRAKGLTVVKETRRLGDHCGTTATSARASSTRALNDGVAEEVVVLVLGGRAVTDAREAATSAVRRSSTGGALFPAEPGRRGNNSSLEDASYRTVLLRYVLPSAPPGTIGSDVVCGGKGASDSGSRSSTHTSSQVPGGSNEKCPASAPSSSCGGQAGRGNSSVSTGNLASGSTPSMCAQRIAETDSGKGDGTRLEAVLLEAVAGAERRMDDRFDRIERMLVGVCDRLGVLEDAVKGQRPN